VVFLTEDYLGEEPSFLPKSENKGEKGRGYRFWKLEHSLKKLEIIIWSYFETAYEILV